MLEDKENNTENNEDFDIIEEGVEEAGSKDDDGEDKAVSNARDDDDEGDSESTDSDSEADGHKLSNAEKRRVRKKRLKEKLDSKDSVIRAQNERIRMLEDRFEATEKKVSNHDLLQLDKAINDTADVVSRANDLYHQALREGDAEVAKKLMQEMYDARQRHDKLVNVKSSIEVTSRQPSKLDPVLRNNTNSWMTRNPWFKPESNDIDSKITHTIDVSVMNDGYDPRTKEYWKELDRRLAKHLPHRFKGNNIDEDTDDDVEYEDEVVKKKLPKSVISGGGASSSGGRTKVVLSKQRVQALKDAGYWDDPAARNKMVKEYLAYDRQNKGR